MFLINANETFIEQNILSFISVKKVLTKISNINEKT